MTNETTPTQNPAGAAQVGAQDAANRSGRSAAVSIATAIAGALVLLGLGASAATAVTAASAPDRGSIAPVDATGVTALDLEVGAAELTLEFGSVREATLRTSGTRAGAWSLSRDGEDLIVRGPGTRNGGYCFLGVCPPDRGGNASATLTLPESLSGKVEETDVRVGAGAIRVDGDLGELGIDVGAGTVTATGSASSLEVKVGVGEFSGTLEGVAEADIEVSVGDARLELRGDSPKSVDLRVSIGSIDVALPRGVYAVKTTRDLGEVRNGLTTAADSPNRVSAAANLGEITLRETR